MDDEGWNSDDQYDYYDDDSRYDDSGRYSNWSDVIDQDSSSNNGSSWGNKMQERAERRKSAKAASRDVENGASKKGGNSPFMTAVQNAREAEAKGEFKNNVEGKMLEKANRAAKYASPGASLLLNKVRKGGPFASILLIVAVLISIFAGTQSLAPFGLVANGLDQFNNLRTSMNKRTTYFMRFQMDKTRNHPITRKATIFSAEKFKISKKMATKLGKQNVYYIDTDAFNCRFLLYTDKDTGKTYAVAANDNDVEKLPSGGIDVEINGEMRHFDISDSGRMKIDDALLASDNFTRSVDVGSRTLKGHVAGWFDDVSRKFHDRIGSSRNKFRDAPEDADEEDIRKRAKTADDGLSEDIAETNKNKSDPEQEVDDGVDEDGNPKTRDESTFNGEDSDAIPKNASEDQVRKAVGVKTKAVIGAMGKGVDIYCTVMKAYSMLSALIAGVMIANIINYITGFLEAIQKTQAGDGGKTELSYYMTGLSQKGATKDMHGNVIEGKESTSSLESPAWNQFFSSGSLVVSNSDKAAQKFNQDNAYSMAIENAPGIVGSLVNAGHGITSAISNSITAYKTCLLAQGAFATADLVATVVVAFVSFGIGAFIKTWIKDLLKDVVLGAIQLAIMTAFNVVLIPMLARWMAVDLISNMAGEDAAYAINSGFNIYLGRQMQSSSGLPATEAKLMAHWREQQEVIAEEGALERSMRSPFDPSSKHTFLGSIVNSLMPIANTWSSPLTTISKTANTVGVAFANMLPTARADGEVRFETSLNKECPTLSQIGLVGDAYCNPYFVTDFSTMGEDPAEVMNQVMTDADRRGENGNFDWTNVDDAEHNGNPDINGNSDLGKWVVSCAVRDSQFGQVDSNVMGAIAGLINTGNGAVDTALTFGLGLIPFVDDAVDIGSAAKEGANVDWASGENCIKEDYKYYSRYSEDQRMMESAGIIEKSSVAKFLDKYYEENPIDNSWEGTIARYSGLTKDQVAETMEGVEIAQWLAEYNPENYGPMKFEDKGDGGYQYESDAIIANAENAIVGNYIVFDDLRTKVKIA